MNYHDFLESKAQSGANSGFAAKFMPSNLFDFQQNLVEFNCWKGRSATFADCGLGKTAMQMAWAQNVVEHTNRHVLNLTPLAVSPQAVREGHKFSVDSHHSRDGSLPSTAGIVVTNYEKLHLFNSGDF